MLAALLPRRSADIPATAPSLPGREEFWLAKADHSIELAALTFADVAAFL